MPSRNPYPIMGPESVDKKYNKINLSTSNHQLPNDIDYDTLSEYIDDYVQNQDASYAIGGYLERRNLYGLSDHFSTGEPRDIHLGVDIWTYAGHRIYAPIDGVIHSFAYNDQHLDYGYTLILEHHTVHRSFHTLYGHLSSEYFEQWQIGTAIKKGNPIASLGDRKENGGWPPHLHFQVVKDMGDWHGDYPGVCKRSELDYYKQNCPDPAGLIKTQNLLP